MPLRIYRRVTGNASSASIVVKEHDVLKADINVQTCRAILTRELEAVGIRLNQRPPDIYFKVKKTGGISFQSVVPLTHIDEKLCYQILHEYKIHNAEVLFREDATVDQLIDVIEGNRKYVQCLYVYNKIDMLTLEEVEEIAEQPNTVRLPFHPGNLNTAASNRLLMCSCACIASQVVISCNMRLNLETLLDRMWEEMALVRVYTKPPGGKPDFDEPVVLSTYRGGISMEHFCDQV